MSISENSSTFFINRLKASIAEGRGEGKESLRKEKKREKKRSVRSVWISFLIYRSRLPARQPEGTRKGGGGKKEGPGEGKKGEDDIFPLVLTTEKGDGPGGRRGKDPVKRKERKEGRPQRIGACIFVRSSYPLLSTRPSREERAMVWGRRKKKKGRERKSGSDMDSPSFPCPRLCRPRADREEKRRNSRREKEKGGKGEAAHLPPLCACHGPLSSMCRSYKTEGGEGKGKLRKKEKEKKRRAPRASNYSPSYLLEPSFSS